LRKKREDLEKDLELILELVDTQSDQKVKQVSVSVDTFQ
jgi:hypothetical protein